MCHGRRAVRNMNLYILDADGTPIPAINKAAWTQWFETENWRVAYDKLGGDVRVSTIFLGRTFPGLVEDPLLFETMIFVEATPKVVTRYATRAEALAGHAKAVETARGWVTRPPV